MLLRLFFFTPYSYSDLPRLFSEVDVVVVPSEDLEISPLVIKEAFSANKVVIASNIGGIPELIDSKNGFLFEAGNKAELHQLLASVIDDPTILNKKSVSDSACIKIEDTLPELMQIYHSALQ